MRVLVILLVSVATTGFDGQVAEGTAFAFTCRAFPAALTEADLVARYGRENVIRAAVFGADDGALDGTVVFPTTPEASISGLLNEPTERRSVWPVCRPKFTAW